LKKAMETGSLLLCGVISLSGLSARTEPADMAPLAGWVFGLSAAALVVIGLVVVATVIVAILAIRSIKKSLDTKKEPR
jgi:hypothetical protein